jgi:putative flippase GtrA
MDRQLTGDIERPQHFATVGARGGSEGRRVLQYLLVGAVGFLVDGGVLAFEVHLLRIGPYLARGPSFLAAVTATWLLNRRHTFADLGCYAPGKEYRLYVASQTIGALANLGVYALAIRNIALCAEFPVIALALGSAVALAVNYTLARFYVFPALNRL